MPTLHPCPPRRQIIPILPTKDGWILKVTDFSKVEGAYLNIRIAIAAAPLGECTLGTEDRGRKAVKKYQGRGCQIITSEELFKRLSMIVKRTGVPGVVRKHRLLQLRRLYVGGIYGHNIFALDKQISALQQARLEGSNSVQNRRSMSKTSKNWNRRHRHAVDIRVSNILNIVDNHMQRTF
ncbi:hypothetical protein K458DRAFT_410086 [Lentithecium fluviatile CBS 122367]|uniref:Uncharacterized protein n=1 Tax=Lentithecium fluviatile CBS 122367 TaxID=1168545 RepID=A0A6G1IF89_9PLEO|nr:hypothetical protein K458DRAFT_410086 [Lentithecium fluviatile CBS 122367]